MKTTVRPTPTVILAEPVCCGITPDCSFGGFLGKHVEVPAGTHVRLLGARRVVFLDWTPDLWHSNRSAWFVSGYTYAKLRRSQQTVWPRLDGES